MRPNESYFYCKCFLLVLHEHFSSFLWHIWKKNNYNFTEKENNATWYIAHNIIVLLYCSKGRFNHYQCIYLVCGFNIDLNLKVQRKKTNLIKTLYNENLSRPDWLFQYSWDYTKYILYSTLVSQITSMCNWHTFAQYYIY